MVGATQDGNNRVDNLRAVAGPQGCILDKEGRDKCPKVRQLRGDVSFVQNA
jgi:hypothetical protein